MRRFVEGIDREQGTLFPECLADWIDEDNPVRVIDAFVDKLDLSRLGFDGVAPEATGRPSYHPSVLLKLYIYGYLNQVQSSRSTERDRSFSQFKRTERTTARQQIGTMVRGGCYRDGKDSFNFLCSRGSNQRSHALPGNMTARTPALRCAR
jgi:hypothetical protein